MSDGVGRFLICPVRNSCLEDTIRTFGTPYHTFPENKRSGNRLCTLSVGRISKGGRERRRMRGDSVIVEHLVQGQNSPTSSIAHSISPKIILDHQTSFSLPMHQGSVAHFCMQTSLSGAARGGPCFVVVLLSGTFFVSFNPPD